MRPVESSDFVKSGFEFSEKDSLTQRLHQRLETIKQSLKDAGEKILLYGATWHAVPFLGAMESETCFVAALDDNEDYTGCSLYDKDKLIPVIHPANWNIQDDQAILITAHLHKEAIKDSLRQKGFRGQILEL